MSGFTDHYLWMGYLAAHGEQAPDFDTVLRDLKQRKPARWKLLAIAAKELCDDLREDARQLAERSKGDTMRP